MELNMIRSKKVTLQDIENINELEKYDLSERVFEYYRSMTRGNDFLKIDEVKKKLIRNILLSYEAPTKVGLERKRVFYYGNLLIQLNTEERTFCYIDNIFGKDFKFKLDMERRIVLNYMMGLQNDKY